LRGIYCSSAGVPDEEVPKRNHQEAPKRIDPSRALFNQQDIASVNPYVTKTRLRRKTNKQIEDEQLELKRVNAQVQP
jgi:hypothetical protein